MKMKIFTITGILVFVTLTYPIIACDESSLTKQFRKLVTPENINSVNGYRPKHSKSGRSFFRAASPAVGRSFFEVAIDEDDLSAIKFLLAKGANIECLGSHGEPPLHYAIRNHRTDIVRELLARGANCNAGGINHERPLHGLI